MKVHAFPSGTDGLDYHRIIKPLKWMEKRGVEVKNFGGNDKSTDSKWWELPEERLQEARDWADVLFIKGNVNSRVGALAEGLGCAVKGDELVRYKPIIMDVDDDHINLPWYHPNFESREKNRKLSNEIVELTGAALIQARIDEKKYQVGDKGYMGKVVEIQGRHFLYWNTDPDLVLHQMIEASDLLVVTTEHLADLYRKNAKNIVVLPNGIDFEDIRENVRKNDGTVRLGLFGSTSHFLDWLAICPMMKSLLDEFDNLVVVMNGWAMVTPETKDLPRDEQKYDLKPHPAIESSGLAKHPRVEIHDVSSVWKWYEYLAEKGLDLIAAPLVPDKFNAGKSNLKFLEHGAMKVPGVFSYHGPFKFIHREGVGLTGRGNFEFHQQLRKLIKDKELRLDLGEKAYAYVRQHHDMADIGKKYASEFQKVLDQFETVRGKPDTMYKTA